MLKLIFLITRLIAITGKKLSRTIISLSIGVGSLIFSKALIIPPISLHMRAIDSLSAPLIFLTLWISILILISSPLKLQMPQVFLRTVVSLMIILIFAFIASSILQFYFFFEASLIPTAILVLLWGYQPERLQASFYLILYTIAASFPLLICILTIYSMTNSLFMPTIILTANPYAICPTIWVLVITAFLVKLPIYGVHLWLPKAHVEAPVAGSMVLAAILLKLGGYALLRLTLIFPWQNHHIRPIIISLTLIGALYARVHCLRQPDLKALVAYRSVAHIGLMAAGIIRTSAWAFQGALLMIVSHGLSSSGLFAAANTLYEMTQTRRLFLTKGILSIAPAFAIPWFLLIAARMGCPPSINLLREVALITSLINVKYFSAPILFLIILMRVGYSLHLFTASMHGYPPSFISPTRPPQSRRLHSLYIHVAPVFLFILFPDPIWSFPL